MKRYIPLTILLAVFLLTITTEIFSQDKTLLSPAIQFQYSKNGDSQRILKTTLTCTYERNVLPLEGFEISVFSGSNKKELIGSALTDAKGVAKVELNQDFKPETDNEGMWVFSTEFKGNDTIEAGTSELLIKNIILDVTYSPDTDSIKTLSVNAYTESKGEKSPVADEKVLVIVPRMFSMLQIGEITLDENGSGSVEFPADLPGNKEGIFTVIAKIDENATFGTIEKQAELKWGIPTDYSQPSSHRALWTKTAPKWMIYTLSILLAGVWGHYLFAIISLIRIRLDAKKQEALDNYGKVVK